MLSKGILIVFEGIDGSGKSTQSRHLYQHLADRGLEVILTREPSDTIWGKKIRELSSKEGNALAPEEEFELFMKDRREHVAEIIQPALDGKKIVITDRYYFSTIAYQGAAGIDIGKIRKANRDMPAPDMVFYLSIEPEDSIQRIKKNRNSEFTQFEKEDYLKRVKAIFDKFDEPYIHKIDASVSVEDVSKKILQIMSCRGEIYA